MINPAGLVMRDTKLIARFTHDGNFVSTDGLDYGWLGFDEFIMAWADINGK